MTMARQPGAKMMDALRIASGEGATTWSHFVVHRCVSQFLRARKLGWIATLPREHHHSFALYKTTPAGREVLATATKEKAMTTNPERELRSNVAYNASSLAELASVWRAGDDDAMRRVEEELATITREVESMRRMHDAAKAGV